MVALCVPRDSDNRQMLITPRELLHFLSQPILILIRDAATDATAPQPDCAWQGHPRAACIQHQQPAPLHQPGQAGCTDGPCTRHGGWSGSFVIGVQCIVRCHIEMRVLISVIANTRKPQPVAEAGDLGGVRGVGGVCSVVPPCGERGPQAECFGRAQTCLFGLACDCFCRGNRSVSKAASFGACVGLAARDLLSHEMASSYSPKNISASPMVR